MPKQRQASPCIVRAAQPADDAGIEAVAHSTGQPPSQSGQDRTYTAHLRQHGRLLVAERDGQILGYGATLDVGTASMLTDLFVDATLHGAGVGRALLDALWPAPPGHAARFTFASQDPRAISLYIRSGLTPLWPLLYLQGRPDALELVAVTATRVPPADAARVEAKLTGVHREFDLDLLSGADPSGGLVVTRDGQVIAAGAATSGTLAHLACPTVSDAADAVVAGLHAVGGDASVCLPGPHPAVPRLLAAGFRTNDVDLHMASRPDLLATSWVYSPSLG